MGKTNMRVLQSISKVHVRLYFDLESILLKLSLFTETQYWIYWLLLKLSTGFIGSKSLERKLSHWLVDCN